MVFSNVNSQRKTVVCRFTVKIPIIHVMLSNGSNTIMPFMADLFEGYGTIATDKYLKLLR